MSNSLKDLLGAKNFAEPPEIQIIKTFIQQNYDSGCQVTIQAQQIIIAVQGASLAGALRMRLHELQAACKTNKRLCLRIIS